MLLRLVDPEDLRLGRAGLAVAGGALRIAAVGGPGGGGGSRQDGDESPDQASDHKSSEGVLTFFYSFPGSAKEPDVERVRWRLCLSYLNNRSWANTISGGKAHDRVAAPTRTLAGPILADPI